MTLTADLKQQHTEQPAKYGKVKTLGEFYFKPLTIHQAEQIANEATPFKQNARHFQVRAKDETGKPLVTPADFDDFCKYVSAEAITDAVMLMSEADNTPEDIEGNSQTAAG